MTSSEAATGRGTLIRLAAEAAVIVLSILLAFWIDAAWELRRERAVALEHLVAVHEELVSNVALLGESAAQCPNEASQAIRGLLTFMGPEPTLIPADSLIRLVARGVAVLAD